MMNPSTKRLPALLCTVLLLATTAAVTAQADDRPANQQPVVVVADFSGSMNEADADARGTTRIAAAKSAVKGLLAEAPAGAELGLVVFGANNDSCSDIQTLQRVGDFDATALGAELDALQARGNTPIGPALSHAAEELRGVEGPASIVLVSDGEPNCEPPPACDVAKQLAGQGIDMTVHTIGFLIAGNQRARDTLRCIAEATGGTYSDVQTADELRDVLKAETTRALQGYVGEGIAVAGGPTLDDPEPIVAGQYVVSMVSGEKRPTEGEFTEHPNRRYFSVPRHEGWDVAVSATLVPPPMETGAESLGERRLVLAQTGPLELFCGGNFERSFQSGLQDRGDLRANIVMEHDRFQACVDDEDRFRFSISRDGEAWADQSLEVEFSVAYYRADESGFGDVADPGPRAGNPAPGQPQPVAGGTSFNDATLLEPGMTISDDINGQERRYFAVALQHGQNLHARLAIGSVGRSNAHVALLAYNPLRQMLQFEQGVQTHPNGMLFASTAYGEVVLQAPLRSPIMPGNVLADGWELAHAFAGLQYLVVSRSWEAETGATAMPYTLTVDVWGEPAPGGVTLITSAEEFEEQFGSPAVETASPSPSPSASGSPSARPDAPPAAPPSARPDGPGDGDEASAGAPGAPLVWGLAGAGALLVAVGAAWYLVRRRR